MTAIVIKNLNKSFLKKKNLALNQLTANIAEGQITGIIGPDGAGKTTLLRILSGLMSADSGECLIFSKKIDENTTQVQEDLSYLPQKFSLYEDLTVSQNLSLYSKLQNVSKEDTYLARLIEFSGLEAFKKRLVGDLSGGMKQKLGLVTTMLRRPKLLLLDEPTVGVDPISQNELWKMIAELNRQGVTVIITTSYLNEAEKCDTILILNEGQLIFSGQPETFKNSAKGKTFFFENIGEIKRSILDQLLKKNHIIDAMIEGEKIRVTFDHNDPIRDPEAYGFNQSAVLTERAPYFEDAFIYKLGGIPNRPALQVGQMTSLEERDKPVIQAAHLIKKFGEFTAVNNVTFSIKRGEIFGLLGPNGAGKSTTFKMLCGLIRPTKGEALVSGVSLRNAPSIARGMIGYMSQKFSLYDNMTVLQNMHFFSGIYPVHNRKNEISRMIEIFALQNYKHVLTSELPLGYKQRLALSCALMHRPKVLFLDEPTSGVDLLTRREFWHQINILASSGVAVLISTHLMDEAEFCDRIGLIHEGELLVIDTPSGLKKQIPDTVSKTPSLLDAFIYFCTKKSKGGLAG